MSNTVNTTATLENVVNGSSPLTQYVTKCDNARPAKERLRKSSLQARALAPVRSVRKTYWCRRCSTPRCWGRSTSAMRLKEPSSFLLVSQPTTCTWLYTFPRRELDDIGMVADPTKSVVVSLKITCFDGGGNIARASHRCRNH